MNKQKTLIFSLSAMLFFSLSFIAYSWNEPTTNMPSGYTAPLNTSSTAQTKIGAITVPMVYDYNNTSYYIDPSGNSLFAGKIGIGTTTPNSKLTIGNNVGVGFDEWNDYQLLLYTGATPQASYGLGIKSGTLAFNTNGRFDFDKNGSTIMTINGANVGIGTTSPQTKLHVNGNIITSRPSNTDHAATKGYVDEQIALVRSIVAGGQPLVNGAHTWNECESAGGTVVDSDVELKQCRFNTSSCPSGWNQYKNFSTTLQQTFTRYESYHQCTASCAVSGHAWGNVARECCSLRTCWTGSSGCSGCSHCGSCWNGYDSACDYSQHLAQISQIGCY